MRIQGVILWAMFTYLRTSPANLTYGDWSLLLSIASFSEAVAGVCVQDRGI
jgi:hypothetical protein